MPEARNAPRGSEKKEPHADSAVWSEKTMMMAPMASAVTTANAGTSAARCHGSFKVPTPVMAPSVPSGRAAVTSPLERSSS